MTEEIKETKLEEKPVEETVSATHDEAEIASEEAEAEAEEAKTVTLEEATTEALQAEATAEDVTETDEADETTSDGEAVSVKVTIESLQSELESVQTEAAKNLEGWQRAVADLANYKRRQGEQAAQRTLEIKANIIREILPALDDLDLAFQNIPDGLNEQEANWVEGFKLVQRKLLKMLEDNNIQTIDAEGEFDPNLHEAVTYEESPDHESNTIIAELRKGYIAGDRVLRPALVRVAQ